MQNSSFSGTTTLLFTAILLNLLLFAPSQSPAATDVDFSIKGVKVINDSDVYVTVRSHGKRAYRGKLDVTFAIPGSPVKKIDHDFVFTNKRSISVKLFSLDKYPQHQGFKTVKFYVDKQNKVKEKNEHNNSYAKSIKFPGKLAGDIDLLIQSIALHKNGFRIILRNQGKRRYSGNLKIGVTINEAKKKDIDVKCNLSAKAEKAIHYPYKLKPGRNIVSLFVDKDNKITETNEKNNKYKKVLYPAVDKLKIERYVAVGKPGTKSRKISSGKEMICLSLYPGDVKFDRKAGVAYAQVDTMVHNLGSLAKGKYSVTVAIVHEGKAYHGTKKIFPQVPKPGKTNRHSMKCKLKFIKQQLLRLRITVGRPNDKGVWYVRDTLDVPLRFWNF